MKIIFDPKIGETRACLMFLYYLYHHDKKLERFKEYGIKPNVEFEKFINDLRQDVNLSEEKLKLYYGNEFGLAKIFLSDRELWEYKELDKCLKYIKQLDNHLLRLKLIKELISKTSKENNRAEVDEKVNNILESEQESLSLIKSLEYDSGLKWELFSFLQEPEKYRDEYISFMEELIPKFLKHYQAKEKVVDEFNKYIEKKNSTNDGKYFRNILRKFMRFDKYDEIYITTSYLDYYSIAFNVLESSVYVYIGIDYEEALAQYEGSEGDKLKKYINIFKNFSDITRFQILKLIAEDKDYSSKDIAEKLGISGATVSYHMNNLFSAELVSMNRKRGKNIYSINKDVMKEGIDFLIREFNLNDHTK
ncbi:ArsR/SmtB family transcription factor [Defluviitalea phaphyphila]|uniref:ArsR/SmtB family transcription factor n=1 Tax=Defluviitalea phaphyphila TaxID=1473580 RepID=UPI000731C416|nr:winged helix-turn-helix transcriptional regulator [Defluviitalea phaphyphila]